MHAMQKMQKLRKANIDDRVPAKKASAFVNEVMVIDGPAWARAYLIRVEAGSFRED